MESPKQKRRLTSSVELPHGGPGARLYVDDLIRHIRESGRDYIIQGQTNCCLADHPKPNSLDAWLRRKYPARSDTKQAVNSVVDQLVKTRLFEVEKSLVCPDSGYPCKGIRLVQRAKRATTEAK